MKKSKHVDIREALRTPELRRRLLEMLNRGLRFAMRTDHAERYQVGHGSRNN